MFSSPRRHPLHSFRFWFLVLGAVAVTVAWRLDLLPFEVGPPHTGSLADQEFVEVDLSESGASPRADGQPHAETDAPFFGDAGPEPAADAAPGHGHSRSAHGSPQHDDPPSPTPTFAQTAQSAPPGAFPADRDMPAQQLPPTSLDGLEDHRSAVPGDSLPPEHFPAADDAAGAVAADAAAAGSSRTDGVAVFNDSERSPAGDDDGGTVRVVGAQNPFTDRDHHVQPAVGQAVPDFDFSRVDDLMQSARPEDHIEAHRELSTLYWKLPEMRPRMQERIDGLARKIYFMPEPHYMEPYTIQGSDLLQKVAKEYNVSWQYLAKLNRVDPQRIRPGQRLKVIKGPFSAIVDLSDYELTIHAHGYYVAKFPVGIGKDGSTPLGEMTVQEKLIDPTYYGPEGVIAHDDPSNPLGERWIDLGESYGIHGTIEPDSIGKSESRGCIRLHNADVAVVYDLLTIGSHVEIRE